MLWFCDPLPKRCVLFDMISESYAFRKYMPCTIRESCICRQYIVWRLQDPVCLESILPSMISGSSFAFIFIFRMYISWYDRRIMSQKRADTWLLDLYRLYLSRGYLRMYFYTPGRNKYLPVWHLLPKWWSQQEIASSWCARSRSECFDISSRPGI